MIGSPGGFPSERNSAGVGAVSEEPLTACQVFHFCITCSRPWQPYNNNNNNDWVDDITMSASEKVTLHRLSTLGGRIYFVNFYLSMRRGQSRFLPQAGNSIQLNKDLLIY